MADRVNIRAVSPADRESWGHLWKAYCEFYEETVADDVTEATWMKFLDDKAPLFSFIAEDSSGKALGFTNCVVCESTWAKNCDCYLEDLFVDPDVRGLGTGRALIETVLEKARSNGWRRVFWQTNKNNLAARMLYEKITPVSDWVIYEIDA